MLFACFSFALRALLAGSDWLNSGPPSPLLGPPGFDIEYPPPPPALNALSVPALSSLAIAKAASANSHNPIHT